MGGRKCVRPRANTSAVGYIRVSTEEQTLGPEAQRVALACWAEARKIQLVAVHEDRGVSGAAPLDRRPGLLAALASLESHSAAFLVAAKRDRLARDVIIAAQLERLVERQGARVVSADGAGEGYSPEAVLMRRLVDAIAAAETTTRRIEVGYQRRPRGRKPSAVSGQLCPVSYTAEDSASCFTSNSASVAVMLPAD